jgi:uncharacterized membrane protein
MIWLVLGLVLWTLAHAFPSLAAGARGALIARLGEGPYKGLFALVVVGAVVLMVIGWRVTVPVTLYAPLLGAGSAAVTAVLVLIAFLLFPAGRLPSNSRRVLRHPQLTAVALWAAAHLISNGDTRGVVLFGWLGLWALVEMALINRRKGIWVRPGPVPLAAEIKPLGAGVILFVVFLLLHPYLFGVAPFGG